MRWCYKNGHKGVKQSNCQRKEAPPQCLSLSSVGVCPAAAG